MQKGPLPNKDWSPGMARDPYFRHQKAMDTYSQQDNLLWEEKEQGIARPGKGKGVKKKGSSCSHDVSFGKARKEGALSHSLQSFQEVFPGLYLSQFTFHFYSRLHTKVVHLCTPGGACGLYGWPSLVKVTLGILWSWKLLSALQTPSSMSSIFISGWQGLLPNTGVCRPHALGFLELKVSSYMQNQPAEGTPGKECYCSSHSHRQ